MTRLLREHPAIEVEMDAEGAIRAIGWNGRREVVEVCNRWRVEEAWWRGPIARDYSLSSDWDDRWRTGGTVDEVIDEAHLGPTHIVDAIERFVAERDRRLARLVEIAEAAASHQ